MHALRPKGEIIEDPAAPQAGSPLRSDKLQGIFDRKNFLSDFNIRSLVPQRLDWARRSQVAGNAFDFAVQAFIFFSCGDKVCRLILHPNWDQPTFFMNILKVAEKFSWNNRVKAHTWSLYIIIIKETVGIRSHAIQRDRFPTTRWGCCFKLYYLRFGIVIKPPTYCDWDAD